VEIFLKYKMWGLLLRKLKCSFLLAALYISTLQDKLQDNTIPQKVKENPRRVKTPKDLEGVLNS
jgi:hypothetical protein